MKKGLKQKWLSFVLMLFIALGGAFSVAAVMPQAKAEGQDVIVRVQEIVVPAGQTSSFTVYADSQAGFSSYELRFYVPTFMNVLEIESGIPNGTFEYNYDYVTYVSAIPQGGKDIPLFIVTFTTDVKASGESGFVTLEGSSFTDVYGNYLSVAEYNGKVSVSGEYSRLKGDFDGDGCIDIRDVMYMQRYMVGTYNRPVADTDIWAGDIDGNGAINIRDCQLVQSYIVGIIGSLEDYGGGSGEQPHGGDQPQGESICGIYTHFFEDDETSYTATLTLNGDHTFTEQFSDDGSNKGGLYFNNGNQVYLVNEFTLETVYVYPGEWIFDSCGLIDYTQAEITAEGYEGTYSVNGYDTDNVIVQSNGAFLRMCEEDGHPMAYNGMISVVMDEFGRLSGVAYVFGTDASNCVMAIPFTMDKEGKVINVEEGGGQHGEDKECRIFFYVDDTEVGFMDAKKGTAYNSVYSDFLNAHQMELTKKYGAIDFTNCYTDSERSVFGDSLIEFDDTIHFSTGENMWVENTKTYAISFKGSELTLYYGATREDVLNLLVGKTVSVGRVYVNKKTGSYKTEWFKDDAKITADMIGDTSKLDFSGESSSRVEIPVFVEGRAATIDVCLKPNMEGAKVVCEGVAESTYYVSGDPRVDHRLLKFYDNGVIGYYYISEEGVVNAEPNGYTVYKQETYNGKTLYLVSGNQYMVLSGSVKLGEKEYQIFDNYRHGEDETTTDYYLNSMAMGKVVFKVFNGDFAEYWSPYYGSSELVHQATVKVTIKDGNFYYFGIKYSIGEGNVLSIALPDGEPIFVTTISGADVYFYDGGMAYVMLGGEVAMTMDWKGESDMSAIYCNLAGEDISFYKWNLDGKYHYGEEPDWNDVLSTRDLVYVKDGETTNYTLFRFMHDECYLFDGELVERVQSASENVLYQSETSGETHYYYYNDAGEMYDALWTHVEDARGLHFGYVYIVNAKGLIAGYWQLPEGVHGHANISDAEFRFTINGDGNYVVTYKGDWLYTAEFVDRQTVRHPYVLRLLSFAGKVEYVSHVYIFTEDGGLYDAGTVRSYDFSDFVGEVFEISYVKRNYKEPGNLEFYADRNKRTQIYHEDTFTSGDIYVQIIFYDAGSIGE